MPSFYVSIERRKLPASDPLRWFIVAIDDAPDPIEAIVQATRYVQEDMRLKHVLVWAAVRDCPSLGYMQELRESMDACRYSRRARGPIGSSIPGYV